MSEASPATPRRILILGDDPGFVAVLQGMLAPGMPGASLHAAGSLDSGLERIALGGMDLVLLDADLPGSHSLEALEGICGAAEGPAVIILAGDADEAMALQALRAGAQDVLAKGSLDGPLLERAARHAMERRAWQCALLRTEQGLRENQEMFRLISEYAGDLVSVTTRDGRRVYQNHAYARALGYTLEDLSGIHAGALLHPGDRERIRGELEELFQSGKEATTQFRMRHRNGSWRHFECRAARVGGGSPEMAVIVARDVTERLQADLELIKAHAIKNLILEHSSLGIAYVRKRVFEWANSRLGEIMGRPMDQILGASMRIAYPDDASFEEMGRAAYPAMQGGDFTDITWQLRRGDGSMFWCRMIGRPLDLSDPDEGSVWMMEDITSGITAEQERLSLEVQLRHAQKLEAIGQLAAGIAHEINTPTQYIGDNTTFLAGAFRDVFNVLDAQEQALGPGPLPGPVAEAREEADLPFLRDEIPRAIDQSLEGLARVTRIVRAMKDFSHPGTDNMVDVDLNRSIESTVTVSRNEWKYVADLVLELDPALPQVLCHPSEINQALLNLIINAAHAIGDAIHGSEGKGTITISTTHADGIVEIRVRDTGTGIPEHVRSRIFDPFFTTKSVGKGTGQGLAIVHNVVVERHKGTVAFETELGHGSVFILRVPTRRPAP